VFEAIDQLLITTYQVYNLNIKCYAGAIESWILLVGYTGILSDPSFLGPNFLFNFGHMYDSVKDIIVFFNGSDTGGNAKSAFQVGFEIGELLYYVLHSDSVS